MINNKYQAKIAEAIKSAYPDIDWDRFEDADRALNWELWHGPLPSNYWTYVEPLDHYKWEGWTKACNDITEMLDSLPYEVYYSVDGEYVTDSNPEDDDGNWSFQCEHCDEMIYICGSKWLSVDTGEVCVDGEHSPDDIFTEWSGGDWIVCNTRQYLMHKESYAHTF